MKLLLWAVLVVMLAGIGCTPEYLVLESDYFLKERNYTFAIYNQENRLLTHPLKDLQSQINLRKLQKKFTTLDRQIKDPAKPRPNNLTNLVGQGQTLNGGVANSITDVYVVAHGWNFPLEEGISSFNEYMESIEHEIKSNIKENFQPYFILVAWPSATRPLTNLARATLPFGVDDLLIPVSVPLDQAIFFLPTVWKQSINATKNALGSEYPNDYIFKSPQHEEFGSTRGDLNQVGRDIPLSALLFQLIQIKEGLAKEQESEFKIHVVGHSYGAKMSALGSMEALRRWAIQQEFGDEILELWGRQQACFKAGRSVESFQEVVDGPSRELMKVPGALVNQEKSNTEALENFSQSEPFKSFVESCKKETIQDQENNIRTKIWSLESAGEDEKTKSGVVELWDRLEIKNTKAQKDAIAHEGRFGKMEDRLPTPIESLVLFNPAMHPREFDYLTDASWFDAYAACGEEYGLLFYQGSDCHHRLLRLIGRKGIVFSNYDFANGLAFSLTQGALNNSYTQKTETWMENELQKREMELGWQDFRYYPLVKYPLQFAFNTGFGAAGLAGGIVGGIFSWSEEHVREMYFLAAHVLNPLWKSSWDMQNVQVTVEGMKGRFQDVAGGQLLVLPKIGSPINELGIFRPAMPALGRAGLRGLTIETDENPYLDNLKGLREFYHPQWSNIKKEQFCYSSKEIRAVNSPLFYRISAQRFYSFDASEIYESVLPPLIGAHGDLRELDRIFCNESGVEIPYVWSKISENIRKDEDLNSLSIEGISGKVLHVSYPKGWDVSKQQAVAGLLRDRLSPGSASSTSSTHIQNVKFWNQYEDSLKEIFEEVLKPSMKLEPGKCFVESEDEDDTDGRCREFENWFRGLSLVRVVGDTAYFQIPREEIGSRLFEHSFPKGLEALVTQLLAHDEKNDWETDPNDSKTEPKESRYDRITAKFSYQTRILLESYKPQDSFNDKAALRTRLIEEFEDLIQGDLMKPLTPIQQHALLVNYQLQETGKLHKEKVYSHPVPVNSTLHTPWFGLGLIGQERKQLINRILLAEEFPGLLITHRSFFQEWEAKGREKFSEKLGELLQSKKALNRGGLSRICFIEGKTQQPKRSYTFNFVYNFTKNLCIAGGEGCQDKLIPMSPSLQMCDSIPTKNSDANKSILSREGNSPLG